MKCLNICLRKRKELRISITLLISSALLRILRQFVPLGHGKNVKVAVIGAGEAGLAAAYELRKQVVISHYLRQVIESEEEFTPIILTVARNIMETLEL
ncbi:MAG TPA: hypothetical protein VIK72_01845 [Clostridiaceae bacterium]